MQDFIVGPYDETLKTSNFPVLSGLIGLAFGGDTPFQAEVYFINLAKVNQIKFAVPFFDVYDPRFLDFGVPVAVRGSLNYKIVDYKEFIKLHRLINFSVEDFKTQIKDSVRRYVKNAVANAPSSFNIPVIQIESKISEINAEVERKIKNRLKEEFGVLVSSIDISAIEIDKTSRGYSQLAKVTKDVTASKIKAETEDYEERLRIRREEEQYAMRMRAKTENIDVYRLDKGAEVGVAGAEALGKMGEGGAGRVDVGGGAGFNPASMMAGIAVGGVVGRTIAETMGSTMSGVTVGSAVPPPIPTVSFYVASEGRAIGPFDMTALTQMAMERRFTRETLVWKQGMAEWKRAGEIAELDSVFGSIPPSLPT